MVVLDSRGLMIKESSAVGFHHDDLSGRPRGYRQPPSERLERRFDLAYM